MPKIIHVIVVGDQDEHTHLAGIPRLRGDEVLLFSLDKARRLKQIKDSIGAMGIDPRLVSVEDEYLDSFKKANVEAAASYVDDVVVAINMSTGSRIISSAIEDAFRIQLVYFHLRSREYSGASAFRYFVSKASGTKIQIAPIWNSNSKYHNDMFDILAETKEPITVTKLHEILYDRGSDIGGYESFRKEFRRFRKWFKNMPCFKESVKKGPEFMIDLD